MKSWLWLFDLVPVGSAEQPWWERQADRFVHVEGWAVPAPVGWQSAVAGDTLRLSDSRQTLVLSVADSLAEVEAELMRVCGVGRLSEAQAFLGRRGVPLVRRAAVLEDCRIVHVTRPEVPDAHLVVYCQGGKDLPESFLREVDHLRRL